MRAGLLTEEVGLDGYFIGDHPGNRPEAFVHLAALARETTSIELGSIVFCIYHRHPVMFARQIADLDQLSRGRALIGLGIGWNVPEFARLGTDPATSSGSTARDGGICADRERCYGNPNHSLSRAKPSLPNAEFSIRGRFNNHDRPLLSLERAKSDPAASRPITPTPVISEPAPIPARFGERKVSPSDSSC